MTLHFGSCVLRLHRSNMFFREFFWPQFQLNPKITPFNKRNQWVFSIAVFRSSVSFIQLLIRFVRSPSSFASANLLNNISIPFFVRRAQALAHVQFSPTMRENGLYCEKKVELFQNFLFGKIQFSQKSLTHKERRPQILLQQDFLQQNQLICGCYYKLPAEVCTVYVLKQQYQKN